jgi:predicted transcriptional regulator
MPRRRGGKHKNPSREGFIARERLWFLRDIRGSFSRRFAEENGFCDTVSYKGGVHMAGTITVRLPDKLRRELDRVAKAERASKSEIMREAIARYLSVKRFRQLRRHVLPFAEAEGLLTDEDVFNSIR